MQRSEDIYTLVKRHSRRLGVNPDVAYENAIRFAEIVGKIENNGKLVGKNPTSTAKGLYQFLDGSVPVAIRRLTRTIVRSWMQPYVNPNDLNWEQQTLMFLADLLEKVAVVNGRRIPGLGDSIMRRVLKDASDTEAIKEAYYILHHTDPDEATKRLVERVLRDGTKDTI